VHNYSLDSDIKTKTVWILTIISVILIFIIGIVANMFGINFIPLQINLENIIKIAIKLASFSLIFVLLYLLFDKFLWKTTFIKKIHGIPDFNGKWEGNFISNRMDENSNNYTGSCNLIVKQTWGKISIVSNFEKSTSYSKSAYININGVDGITLSFDYNNKAEKTNDSNLKQHNGHNDFTYIESENKLRGNYFNDKNRETNGIIEVIKL